MPKKNKKEILFLTGTRADFSKMKTLMNSVEAEDSLICKVFITGMHNLKLYGNTAEEVEKENLTHTYRFINQHLGEPMEMILVNTVGGLSRYVHENRPDMIVVHGDRVEAMAGAIVGSMQNILVSHIEGGEKSGTIDELIRHSVTKLSHLHFVANEEAKKRLIQMGEIEDHIFIIGSPDFDVMTSKNLPTIKEVKKYYNLDFEEFAIAMFHPVTTEYNDMEKHANNFIEALAKTGLKYLIVYPNNDEGTKFILDSYKRYADYKNFRFYPSIRFEHFLTALKHSQFIVGNSSAGIREAPFYGVPTINIGTRQNNRYYAKSIINCDYESASIVKSIEKAVKMGKQESDSHFGKGSSDKKFLQVLKNPKTWEISAQKCFNDVI